MNAVLQKSDLFGPEGPQEGTPVYIGEIRKVEGEYMAFAAVLVGQDAYTAYWINLDHLMVAHTENTETYWSTQ